MENIENLEKKFPYFRKSYDSKGRFCSYWHQINEILQLKPAKVLEVGVGNRFVTNYLRNKEVNITSIDIYHDLVPDIVGSVLMIPFKSESFDVVACYEVLEHIHYTHFTKALEEISRVSQKHIIISLPDVTPICRIDIRIPKIMSVRRLIWHPFLKPVYHKWDKEHYWEIGKRHYSLERVLSNIADAGFTIIKTYRVFEFNYHRFFILEKRKSEN